MAAPSYTDSDLLWYLEKLNDKELQSVKEHLIQAPLEFRVPEIPWFQLMQAQQEDLDKILTTSYEAHITWNMMFSIFQKISRQDLCDKIEARRKRNKEIHKDRIRENLLLQWEDSISTEVNDRFYESFAPEIFHRLETTFDPRGNWPLGNLNMLLIGNEAAGKTMLTKMAMSLWARGMMWKDTFSYVIHLTAHEINQMVVSSFVELLSKDWPDSQAPVGDILSDSQKLLFILEDLDNIGLNLNIEESLLCSDSRKQVPILLLLVSLLKRKMMPGSSFLISTRPRNQDVIDTLMKEKGCSTNLNFTDEIRQKYFTIFFQDSRRAMIALKFVHENEVLVDLCSVPILSWIVCTTLNQQLGTADDVQLEFRTSSDIHAHFLTKMLTSEAHVPQQHQQVLLQRLCWLAINGILQEKLEFTDQDLRSVELTEADVAVLRTTHILKPSSNYKDHCVFIHRCVQEFCAAIAYMRPLIFGPFPSDTNVRDRRSECQDFSLIMAFIFGLLNKKTRDILEISFDCQLFSDMHRQYFLENMQLLGANPRAMEHHLPLFYCLFENQEEEFVKQIMGFFTEATVVIRENKDLMVSLYCLKNCHPLQRLRLCIQGIFKNQVTANPTSSEMRSLHHWTGLCSLLYTKGNLQELEICNSNLDKVSETILCRAVRHPSCQLQKLKLTYLTIDIRFEELFKTVAHNQNLIHLSLTCVPMSQKIFSLMHEVLANPMCNIQRLSLIKCDLETSECERIASLLENEKLKQLNLSHNELSDKALETLCNGVLHPHCALESLVLYHCCLTESSCNLLTGIVKYSQTLKHLDVSTNQLGNLGAYVLIDSLRMPTSRLEELDLSGCLVNMSICRRIASALLDSQTLRTLELGSNEIGDEGVEPLCDALTKPSCKLENLGLDGCALTNDCSEDLACAFINGTTLKTLNLLGNKFKEDGILTILEGLGHPDCVLETIGLKIENVGQEVLQKLSTVQEQNTTLEFAEEAWTSKEDRTLDEKLGDLNRCPREQFMRNTQWHKICYSVPKIYRST